jgi:hypothetical protein
MLETAIAEVPQDVSNIDDGVWIEALPSRIYHTPQYGQVPVPLDKLERMIHSFRQGVRGQEIATDFEHGLDPTRGLQASGWYKDFDIRPSSDDPNTPALWAKVEFTEDAKNDVKAKKYKYWSLQWDDEYLTDDGTVIPDVIIGGGLTNRPVAKRTMPINFSEQMWNELDAETQKVFAVWSTSYVNSLPDSCFLYIEPGGSKDSEGKTTPRSKRHLPYKNANGSIDLPHLRNAIARIPQMKGISDALKNTLQAKARRLLGGTTKAASEQAMKDAHELLTQKGFHVIEASETAAQEHSDPGIGVPLYASAQEQPDPGTGAMVPRVTGDPAKDDPAIGGQWRREPLPVYSGSGDPIEEQESRQSSGDEPYNPGEPYTFSETDCLTSAIGALANFIAEESDEPDQADIDEAKSLIDRIKILLVKEASEPPDDTYTEVMNAATSFAERYQLDIKPKGGKTSMEFTEAQVNELTKLLQFEGADPQEFLNHATTQFSELKAFKETVASSQQERSFAEQYPEAYERMQRLEAKDRENASISFSESVKRFNKPTGNKDDDGNITFEPTRNGLSALALEEIATTHKKFSEGSATLEDYENTIRTIMNGGIVEFGEVGSSREREVTEVQPGTPQGIAANRKAFADKVAETQRSFAEKNDGKQMDYMEATKEAAKLYPELAEAYAATA